MNAEQLEQLTAAAWLVLDDESLSEEVAACMRGIRGLLKELADLSVAYKAPDLDDDDDE